MGNGIGSVMIDNLHSIIHGERKVSRLQEGMRCRFREGPGLKKAMFIVVLCRFQISRKINMNMMNMKFKIIYR